MSTIFIYDTETTGIPDWSTPSGDESQPHIVQIAAVLADSETREVIDSLEFIIKPDGWEIPAETAAIHGITTERALEVGVDEKEALEKFLKLRGDHLRVAYNKTFDQRIVRIACKRFMSEEDSEKWAVKDDHECAMRMAQKVMGGKNPKLCDAYLHFTGNLLEDAHSAMADTLACMEVYFASKDEING